MSVQDHIDHLTVQRAAEWFEVVRTGQAHRFPEFIDWVTERPRHLEEFLAIAALSPMIGKALRAGALDRKALLANLNASVAPFSDFSAGRQRPRHPRPRWIRPALAAAAALVVLTFAVVVTHRLSSWQRYATSVGEQRIVQLPDGSVLELNAQSRADVLFAAARRDVRLVEGEALFNVAHDARRPFRVHVGNAVVRAVGTQFAVYARTDGTTTVSVLEGKVQVTSAGAAKTSSTGRGGEGADVSTASAGVSAGEQAKIDAAGLIEHRIGADVQSAVAWLQRELVFEHTSLEDMVGQFNRYNGSLRLRLDGISPGSHHYSGTFRADDPESLGAFLAQEGDLFVERRAGEIVIRPRK